MSEQPNHPFDHRVAQAFMPDQQGVVPNWTDAAAQFTDELKSMPDAERVAAQHLLVRYLLQADLSVFDKMNEEQLSIVASITVLSAEDATAFAKTLSQGEQVPTNEQPVSGKQKKPKKTKRSDEGAPANRVPKQPDQSVMTVPGVVRKAADIGRNVTIMSLCSFKDVAEVPNGTIVAARGAFNYNSADHVRFDRVNVKLACLSAHKVTIVRMGAMNRLYIFLSNFQKLTSYDELEKRAVVRDLESQPTPVMNDGCYLVQGPESVVRQHVSNQSNFAIMGNLEQEKLVF